MTIASDDVRSLNARLAGGGGTSKLKKNKIQGKTFFKSREKKERQAGKAGDEKFTKTAGLKII